MPRRFEPSEQHKGYSVSSRMESLMLSRIVERREFLASRNAEYRGSHCAFCSGAGLSQLRNEQMGDEGEDE